MTPIVRRSFAALLTLATGSAFLVLQVASPAAAAAHVVQATFYASPTGSGSTCSSADPCSLEGARDKVRTVNQNMTGDIVVKLKDGTYTLGSTFQLTESASIHDSGTNGFDVIYTRDTGANPILSGGESVTGFTLYDAGKNIYKATVSAGLDTRQLYVDGVRATRARSAGNPGFPATSTGYTIPTSGFYSTMASWGNRGNIEVAATFSWKRARYSVASISGTAMTMDAAGWNDAATQPAYAPRNMAWIENAYELLDSAGEWYLDRSTNALYYIPRPGESMTTSQFVVGKTVRLLDGSGTGATPLHNVQFDGITFAHDSWVEPNTELGYPDFQGGAVHRGAGTWDQNNYLTPAGVNFSSVRNIVIENSTFQHMANAALGFGAGSVDNVIDHNTFTDISGNGINLGGITVADHHGTDPSAIVRNNVISNNTLTTVGAEYFDNPAIFVGYTQGTDVRHNTMHNLPYTGISMGWGWGYVDALGTSVARGNVVRGNLIYDIMKSVPDGGAIYTLGSQPGSSVVDNYAYADHNVFGYLYRDNGSSGFHDTNNVISDQDAGTNIWYRTNTGSGGYWNAHHNNADGNYFSSTMTDAETGGSNVESGNFPVVSYAWPPAAQTVIANAGVDGADITPVTVGDLPLSQGKTATASSTYSATYSADKAVDGDAASRWAQGSGLPDPSWLKVDLGDSYQLSRVETSAYLPSGLGLKYKIEYSTDNSTWSMYADKTAAFSVPGTDTNAGSVVARYVRITLTGTQGQGGSLYEFKVYGTPLPPLSQGKPATASSTYSATYSADKAVDGDMASRWAQGSGLPDPSWLKVDLGASYQLSRVETAAYLPSGLGLKYKIEHSTDDSTWSIYADKTAAYSVPGTDTNAGNVVARYVRITLTATQGQGGSLYEFKVYGSPAAPQPSLLSQGKVATASSTYSAAYSAGKAVDGDGASRWAQGAGLPDPAWLQVDLGAAYQISRTESSANLWLGLGVKYKIEYSTDGSTWSMYADKTGAYSVPGTDTNAGNVVARYVRFTFTATQAQGGSLWEFKVYGP